MTRRIHQYFLLVWKRLKILATGRAVQLVIILPLIILSSMVVILLYVYKQLPPEVPLYYSRPWGNDQLTSPLSLFILPLGSLFWYLLTLFISSIHMYQYRVFAQLLLVFACVVTILSAWELVNILYLVL